MQFLGVWTNLSYGEIVASLAARNKTAANLVLCILHSFLIIAIWEPGTIWGIYGCLMTILCLVWNIVLDRYNRSSLQQKIITLEKKSQVMPDVSLTQKIQKWAMAEFRISALGMTALVMGTIFGLASLA